MSGMIDGGAGFDGSGAADISLPAISNAWNFASDVTLSAWITTTGDRMDVIQLQNGNPLAYLEVGGTTVGGSAGKAVAYFRTDSGGVLVASGTRSVNDGSWHSIQAVRKTGSSVQIYVDGTLDSTTAYSDPGPIDASGNPGKNIGSLDSSYDFNGSLDEIRVSNIARSADWIAAAYHNQSSPATFYTIYPEDTEIVTPVSVTLYASQSQQFTAFGQCGSAVTWTTSPGLGSLTAGGLYTAPVSITTPQYVTITATSPSSQTQPGSAIVTLLPAPQNPTLTLAASAQPPYVTGSSQQFTATLKNQDGTPIADVPVAFTVGGANSNSGSVTTDDNGIAEYTYTGANSGTDTIHTLANIAGTQVASNSLTAIWAVPVAAISTTTVLGRFFPWHGGCCFNASPSDTPLFVQAFPTINFNPPSGAIPGNTTVNVNTRPFTDVTVDQNGNFSGQIVAQGNGYQAGGGSIGGFQAVFTGSFVVANGGDAVISAYVDNEFILGIGGGATRVSGPMESNEETSAISP